VTPSELLCGAPPDSLSEILAALFVAAFFRKTESQVAPTFGTAKHKGAALNEKHSLLLF
jgi:hypothetical protein